MSADAPGTIKVEAAAKINLYLHVTGRRSDGYHLLDSLLIFANLGDQIDVMDSEHLSLEIVGPFAQGLSTGEDNFGLDDYEPKFFHPLPEWASYGPFSVSLKFDDESYQQDIFYFCHVSTCTTYSFCSSRHNNGKNLCMLTC